jgi:succinate-semialdehyde dehydrogenase/glutarate-semialdehyde dehydrogenase
MSVQSVNARKDTFTMSLEVINPATGKSVRRYDEMNASEQNSAIEAVHDAYLQWRLESFAARAKLMGEAARLLRERAQDLGRLAAEEMGKPIVEGVAEANKCALACDYYAENAEEFLADQLVEEGTRKAFVAFRPIGVVLAVMPWNFPFWQVIRFAAPALMAGNGAILKHASNVPGCAIALEALFRDAGFPEHIFRTLMIGSAAVDGVIAHPLVRAVTLTGSTPAGRAVAAKAGAMLKKSVLELGGSDAYLVLDGTNLDFAAESLAKGRLINGGQSCIAAKRFIVLETLRPKFEELLAEKMRSFRVGDPLNQETQIGPMARHDLRDELHQQVVRSIAMGARCLCGGDIPDDIGAFYPPTLLSNVTAGMPAYEEEMFGPVAAVISAGSVDEAVTIANDSVFGLGGGVFTPDIELGERLAVEDIEAGSVFVNGTVVSDPKLPFGGIKESGYGRELSAFGIHEFVNIKTIVISPHGR